MPHHPSEETAPPDLYEKAAKDPSSATESTASDHGGHVNEHNPGGGGGEKMKKASAEDHVSKGPVVPMSMDGRFLFSVLLCLFLPFFFFLLGRSRGLLGVVDL